MAAAVTAAPVEVEAVTVAAVEVAVGAVAAEGGNHHEQTNVIN